MNPQTVKLLILFFLAATVLNVTNYLFYCLYFYSVPSHHALKLNTLKTRFTAKPRPTRDWGVNSFPKNDGKSDEPSNENYRDQSSDLNQFYYYNGVRKGLISCPDKPPGLGPVNIEESVTLEAIEKLHEKLDVGGIYHETDCVARQCVAIIVPYSGQKHQLLKFLFVLHPTLMKQQLDYQIFVVSSNQSLPLNRGKLLNAGFNEVQKMRQNVGWQCIVFHELTLVPVDSRNLYRCSKTSPHQLVAFVGQKSYENKFGGAFAIDPQVFSRVNGFSNLYSGNEAVYDDLYKRLKDVNYTITKSANFGKYSYSTPGNDSNQSRFQTIQTSSPLNLIDGLSTLTYKLNNIDQKQMYTLIDIEVDGSYNSTEKTWNRLLSQAILPTTKILDQ